MVLATPTGRLVTVSLGGHDIRVRPLEARDAVALHAFALQLPRNDLLFLRRDITDPRQVDAWIAAAETGQSTTLIARMDGAIIGYGALAWGDLHWTRETAEVRVAVAPRMRGVGLGAALLRFVFDAAVAGGARKLIAQMTPDQPAALRLFTALGFTEEARLRQHVTDVDGAPRDLIVTAFFPADHGVELCEQCGRGVFARLALAGAQLCSVCYDVAYGEIGGE